MLVNSIIAGTEMCVTVTLYWSAIYWLSVLKISKGQSAEDFFIISD